MSYRVEVQDADGRWVDISPLKPSPARSLPVVLPIATGYIHRHPDGAADIGVQVLPTACLAPVQPPVAWFWLAADTAAEYVEEGRRR